MVVHFNDEPHGGGQKVTRKRDAAKHENVQGGAVFVAVWQGRPDDEVNDARLRHGLHNPAPKHPAVEQPSHQAVVVQVRERKRLSEDKPQNKGCRQKEGGTGRQGPTHSNHTHLSHGNVTVEHPDHQNGQTRVQLCKGTPTHHMR